MLDGEFFDTADNFYWSLEMSDETSSTVIRESWKNEGKTIKDYIIESLINETKEYDFIEMKN